jgi:hypothetical protein
MWKSWKKYFKWSLKFSFGHSMRKKIIIKVDFCKTFGISKLIITPLISCQFRWLDGEGTRLSLWSPKGKHLA